MMTGVGVVIVIVSSRVPRLCVPWSPDHPGSGIVADRGQASGSRN